MNINIIFMEGKLGRPKKFGNQSVQSLQCNEFVHFVLECRAKNTGMENQFGDSLNFSDLSSCVTLDFRVLILHYRDPVTKWH